MRNIILIFFFLFCASTSFAQFSSFSGSNYDKAYEYRAEYNVSDEKIYEGWVEWSGSNAATDEKIWRIAKNYFTGGNLTHIIFAGEGEFIYEWDLRTSYFPSDVSGFLLISDGSSFILLSDGTSKILIRP